jgi:hypothetical protein
MSSTASSVVSAPAAKRGPGRPPLSAEEKAARAAVKEATKAAAKAEKEAAKAAAKAEKEATKAAAAVVSLPVATGSAAKRGPGRPPLSAEEKAARAATRAAAKAATISASASVVSATGSTKPKPILDTILPDDPVEAKTFLIAQLSELRTRFAALEAAYHKDHAALAAIRTLTG